MPNIISIDFNTLDIYSLAVHVNKIPLMSDVTVRNNSEYNFKNLELEITSSPSFFAPYVAKISSISSGRHVTIDTEDIDIDVTKIMYAASPGASVVTLRIKNRGETLAESNKTVQILPYDFIPEINDYTELISSFVTPEQDVIAIIAESVVENIKADASIPVNRDMWDYSDKNTQKAIIKAIYDAIKSLKITFNPINVLTETKPLRVKLSEAVFTSRQGSSLDIALLMCSVAEYFNINSFIIFTPEKTLAGFFYQNNTFNTCVSDDGRAFANLSDGCCDDFCIVDTTSVINGTDVNIESSHITAQKALNAAYFPIVVDVTRARDNGYVSIPNRITQSGNLIFDLTYNNKNNKLSKSSFYDIKSTRDLSAFIKNELLQGSDINTTNIDIEKSIFLVGGVKYIASKMFFNGKMSLKGLPYTNIINSSSDTLEQLQQLNINLVSEDISPTVNAFHEKESLNNRLKVILSNQKPFSSLSVSFGLVRYLYNGKQIVSPLFFAPATFEILDKDGIHISASSSDIALNSSLVNFLSRSGINIESFTNDSSPFDNYTDLMSELQNEFNEQHGFQIFDIVSVSSSEINSQTLADLSSHEYLSGSSILSEIFEKRSLDARQTKEKVSITNIDLPFVLDSTQADAVYNALNNKCSVIKGANGSGKTQVATTIAFSELRKGKKVLYLSDSKSGVRSFVDFSEQAGFKNYIMLFKDNSKVANDFDLSHYSNTVNNSNELSDTINSIINLTNVQDSYYDDIHSVNEIGFSLYEAASQYERYRSFPYSVNFTNNEIANLTRNDTVYWFDTVSSLAKSGADCNEPHSNPLSYIRKKAFSYDLKSSAVIKLTSHISLTQDFINVQTNVANLLGVELSIMKEKQSEVILEMLNCLISEGKYIHYGIFNRPSVESDFAQIEALTLQCDDFFELRDFIKANFTEDIVTVDGDAILSEWRSANSKFAFARASALSSVKNKLKVYCLDAKFITNDNFVYSVNKITRYKKAIALIEDNAQLVYQLCGIDILSAVSSEDKDVFLSLRSCINASQHYLALLSQLYEAEQMNSEFYSHQSNIFKNKDAFLGDIEKCFTEFSNVFNSYKESEIQLVELLDIDITKAKEDNSKIWYYFIVQFLARIRDNIDLLKYWCKWNVEKEKAINAGLSNVVELYESEQMTSNDIKNAFLKGFFKSVTEYFLSCKSSVSEFSSAHLSAVSTDIYKHLSNYRKELKTNVKNCIYQNFKKCADDTGFELDEAIALLKKEFGFEFNSKSNKASVRMLQSAKPCFVTSSVLFVSKFSCLPEFDTVIIDCAEPQNQSSLSLLFPLTKKVIVLDSTSDNKKGYSISEWLIRNNCSVSTLGWLYNTNYSTQVANELFYSNTLSSFLCASRKKNGLNVIQQQGTYDRKNTRVNVIEASTVVDEVVKIKSENPSASVGVYAMTEEQRALIEMLLHKRVGPQEFSKYFDTESKDPFFIRSFEHSSYDVRSTIILSTVFSDDEKSKYKYQITKTIPELSNDASSMKLVNILTSAKKTFMLVTSLSKETLNNFKTTDKNYIFFKKAVLKLLDTDNTLAQSLNTVTNAENPIIREVANHIESLGYKAEFDVGNNKCKIDIAVRNKDKNNYLLGIVFDESIYNSSDSFLGRDLIQNGMSVFGNWNILRIFTVDWFENHTKQLDIITTALNGNSFESDLIVN